MVKWATKRPRERGVDRGSSALGPQGRGIFDRLFGRAAAPVPESAARLEALCLAVASGKGGTGKSFVATNLAVLLHQELRTVSVVDCDFGLACDHLLLGVSPRLTLRDYVTGRVGIRELRMKTPAGPTLVPGAQGVRRMASLADAQLLRLGEGLGELAALDEVLLLDVGAGISPQTVLTMLCADHVLLVTEPEIAALTDAYAVIKCVAQLRQRADFSVVVNRVTVPGEGQRTYDKLAEVAERFTGVRLSYVGEIAWDPTVTRRRLGQLPLAVSDPSGPTAAALRAMRARLEQVTGPLAPRRVAPEEGLAARFREHRVFLS